MDMIRWWSLNLRGLSMSESHAGNTSVSLRIAVALVAALVLLAAAACEPYVKEDEDGEPEYGISWDLTSHDSEPLPEGAWTMDSEGNLVPPSGQYDVRVPEFDCWSYMRWIEEAVVAYRDSMGCLPDSLIEAWSDPAFYPAASIRMDTAYRREHIQVSQYVVPCCPDSGCYLYEHTQDSYVITCPSGHGSIVDGIISWD